MVRAGQLEKLEKWKELASITQETLALIITQETLPSLYPAFLKLARAGERPCETNVATQSSRWQAKVQAKVKTKAQNVPFRTGGHPDRQKPRPVSARIQCRGSHHCQTRSHTAPCRVQQSSSRSPTRDTV